MTKQKTHSRPEQGEAGESGATPATFRVSNIDAGALSGRWALGCSKGRVVKGVHTQEASENRDEAGFWRMEAGGWRPEANRMTE